MKQLFDFEAIKNLIQRKDFKFCYDALSGVAGPFAIDIFNA
jgi:phosphoglucomutase